VHGTKGRASKTRRSSRKPTCFISYAWDGKRHENWVAKLAEALAANGVRVHVDFWETYVGMDIAAYMETQIRKSRFVLLICTPKYSRSANNRRGGVGFETGIVTGAIFRAVRNKRKFIPILRDGSPAKALPTYLMGKLYVDFRMRAFRKPLTDLLRFIFNKPARAQPAVGPPANFEAIVIPRKLARRKPRIAKSQRPRVLRQRQRELTRLIEVSWPVGSARETRRVEKLSHAARDVAALRPGKKRNGR
jgi:hypothetical protein